MREAEEAMDVAMKSKFIAVLSATILTASLVLVLAGGSPAAQTHEGWTRLASGGIDNPGIEWTAPIIEFKGGVYFLIVDLHEPGVTPPAPLWSYGPGGFKKAAADGFGNKNNTGLFPLVENGDYLYCGTTNDVDGGELWRSHDGETWEKVGASGFGNVNNKECYPLGVHGGDVIIGFANWVNDARLYRYDGTKLSRANTDGFGMGFDDVSFGVNYKGGLYVIVNDSTDETCRPLVYKGVPPGSRPERSALATPTTSRQGT